MHFNWDVAKSDQNYRSRGFNFAYASQIFDGRCLTTLDSRRNYGEDRYVAIGSVDDICLTVVYTDRMGEEAMLTRRIISARLSNQNERQRYAKAIAETEIDDQ